MSKKAALAFEDMGALQDTLDKKMDSFIKRVWDSVIENLKSALATTCGQKPVILIVAT